MSGVSDQTRKTANTELERLRRENAALKAKSNPRIMQGRMYPPNDKHPGIWLIRILAVNPNTEFPVKTGTHQGEDGKTYNDYGTFKWLEVDEADLLSAANNEKRSVNLYFNKRGQNQ